MRLKALWDVAPTAHIFVRSNDKVKEFLGEKATGEKTVTDIKPVSYPMFPDSLEVTLKEMKGETR